jgi:putative addiction module killer protein
LESLEVAVRYRIVTYLDRFALGGSNKNVRSVGDNCFELKINTGPGYRIYFGEIGQTVILLLGGGDKSTQFRDIAKIKECWRSDVSRRCL